MFADNLIVTMCVDFNTRREIKANPSKGGDAKLMGLRQESFC